MNYLPACLVAALLCGCSADTAKRTAYETLQNVRQQQCMGNNAQDCGEQDSYDEYRRKREELSEID